MNEYIPLMMAALAGALGLAFILWLDRVSEDPRIAANNRAIALMDRLAGIVRGIDLAAPDASQKHTEAAEIVTELKPLLQAKPGKVACDTLLRVEQFERELGNL